MKRPKNLTALILASLHLVFCALFFLMYFISKDPQRGDCLVLFVPADPWIVLLGDAIQNETAVAALVTVLGTAQWWVIGWALGRIAERFRSRMSNKATSLDAG
jgi:membrane protein YqaA with SNARE-associated domain